MRCGWSGAVGHCSFVSGAGCGAVEDLATCALSATRMLRQVAPASSRLYEQPLSRMQKVIARAAERAIPAECVARAVAHALTAARPQARYLVGNDARFRALLKWICPIVLRIACSHGS